MIRLMIHPRHSGRRVGCEISPRTQQSIQHIDSRQRERPAKVLVHKVHEQATYGEVQQLLVRT